MKTINIAISKTAHEVLTRLCTEQKKNQSDVITNILEKIAGVE